MLHDLWVRTAPDAVHDLVDTDRYPLDPLDQTLIGEHRDRMDSDGLVLLEDFVRPEALESMLTEAVAVRPLAHHSTTHVSPYLAAVDTTLPSTDPRSRPQRSSLAAVAYDDLPAGGALRRLYESAQVRRLVAAVLGVEVLHPYADPLGALSLAVMRDGDELGWHFDFSEFVVSLALQNAEDGGTFDVVPGIRRTDPAEDHEVVEVLEGRHPSVQQLVLRPGTLVVFAGRRSLHRVPPVHGPTDRLVALLSYDTRPDTDSTEQLKLGRYGRSGPRVRDQVPTTDQEGPCTAR